MKITDTMEVRLSTVQAWASQRARRSLDPLRYMHSFEEELRALLSGSDPDGRMLGVADPVRLAAGIEAACAVRSMRAWGSEEGLCPHLRSPKRLRRSG